MYIHFMYREEHEVLFPLGPDPTLTLLPNLQEFWFPTFNSRPVVVNQQDLLPMSFIVGRIYSPKLRDLWVGSANVLPSLLTTTYLPIRHLRIDHTKEALIADTLTQFLICCPLLETFHLVNQSLVDRLLPWPLYRVPLRFLKTFALVAATGTDVFYFLRALHLPSLKFLRIKHLSAAPGSSFTQQLFWWLMAECARTLEDLVLDSQSMPMQFGLVDSMLPNFVNLRILEFHEVEVASKIFESLTPAPNTPIVNWPCPQLRSIILRTVDIPPGEEIINFIQARCYRNPATTEEAPSRDTLFFDRLWWRRQFDAIEEWIVEDPEHLEPSNEDWMAGRRCVLGIFRCVFFHDSTLAALLNIRETVWGLRFIP
ncbi:hypothetical protein M422DRAFT_27386 [Sphaerobolus stellatus SS14]|nr:hypothetical protein M422DRAFT_27386 [Sphaerobolus stellatus SS14]